MKQKYIQDFSAGETISDIFLLSQKTLSQKKNGDNYLRMTFTDKSGAINAVVWDDVDRISAGGNTGDFVKIAGSVSEYRGSLQLIVKEMTRIERDAVDPADFLPVTRRDPEKMYERLKRTVDDTITDTYIRSLFHKFWEDDEFVSGLKRAPAAKKMHHAYIGGLLEHTLSMTVLVREIGKHYSGVDLNILMAGTILHDIGKIREFQYDHVIDYSDLGRLVTHIVIGCEMLDEKIRQVEGFPSETAMLLKHMIVSHHGTREFGSPETPRIIEAVLLHHIDDIDAKMNGIREFMAKDPSEENWTAPFFMLGRTLYKRKTPPSEIGLPEDELPEVESTEAESTEIESE